MRLISQDQFSNTVQAASGVTPDILLITKALTTAEALVQEPAWQRERGWLIREEWWNQRLQQHRGKTDGSTKCARVAG